MIRTAIVSYLVDVCLDLLESDLVTKFTPVAFRFRDCVVGGNYWVTFTTTYKEELSRWLECPKYISNSDRVFFRVTGKRFYDVYRRRDTELCLIGYVYRDSSKSSKGMAFAITDAMVEIIIPV